MASEKQLSFQSGWDKLPKEEQEAIKKRLKAVPEKEVGKPAVKKQNGFSLKGYVRCELSSSDKEAFKEWEGTLGDDARLGRLIEIVEDGYLLKVADTGSGFQASLCAAHTDLPWEGYVLTAHASYAIRATRLLLYKHEILMHGDWLPWMQEEGEDYIR